MGKNIKYKHWKTGEELEHTLGTIMSIAEYKTDLFCPFDNTPIIRWRDTKNKGHKCPNCCTSYDIDFKSQEELNNYFQEHVRFIQEEVQNLPEKSRELSSFLKHAKKQGLLN